MGAFFLSFASAAALAAPAGAQSPTAESSQAMSADEQEIRRLQHEWMNAWARGDRAAIERILAPDYTLTVSSMPARPVTREQWIGMLPRYTTKGFEYRDMRVRLFGHVAIVSSIGRGIGAKVDGVDRSFPFFLTDVWVKRNGRWQVAARYSSMPESGTDSAKVLDQSR